MDNRCQCYLELSPSFLFHLLWGCWSNDRHISKVTKPQGDAMLRHLSLKATLITMHFNTRLVIMTPPLTNPCGLQWWRPHLIIKCYSLIHITSRRMPPPTTMAQCILLLQKFSCNLHVSIWIHSKVTEVQTLQCRNFKGLCFFHRVEDLYGWFIMLVLN